MSAQDPRLSFDLGFAPDVDPTKPGVATECLNFVPTSAGMRVLPEADEDVAFYSTLAEDALGYAFSFRNFKINADSFDEFVGTPTRLYSRNWFSRAWANASRTAGYADVVQWTFERFGNQMLAAAFKSITGYVIQSASIAGSATAVPFTDIAGSPTCSIITAADRFALAFNGQLDELDSWACSARDNANSWTANPATLANSGRLVDPPGPILAAHAFGNDVIVHKAIGMVLGRFVRGSSEVWEWTKLPVGVGAIGARATCVLPDRRIAFVGQSSCYLFDGSNALDVLDGRARRWFNRNRNQGSNYRAEVHYDAAHGNVWYVFASFTSVGSPNPNRSALVVNLATGRIGYAELPATILFAGHVYDDTNQCLGFFGISDRKQYRFNTRDDDTIIQSSIPGSSEIERPYIVTGDVGDPFESTTVDRIRLDVSTLGEGIVTADVETRRNRGAVAISATGTVNDNKYEVFDVRTTGHYHRARIQTEAPMEISGVWFKGPKAAGSRR